MGKVVEKGFSPETPSIAISGSWRGYRRFGTLESVCALAFGISPPGLETVKKETGTFQFIKLQTVTATCFFLKQGKTVFKIHHFLQILIFLCEICLLKSNILTSFEITIHKRDLSERK